MIPGYLINLLIAVCIAFVCGLGTGWQVQDWRYAAKERDRAKLQLAQEKETARVSLALQVSVKKAQDAARIRESALRADVAGARTALISLSDAAADALRKAHDSHAACVVVSATFADVFKSCSDQLRELAEVTDRWESDSLEVRDAWPKFDR